MTALEDAKAWLSEDVYDPDVVETEPRVVEIMLALVNIVEATQKLDERWLERRERVRAWEDGASPFNHTAPLRRTGTRAIEECAHELRKVLAGEEVNW